MKKARDDESSFFSFLQPCFSLKAVVVLGENYEKSNYPYHYLHARKQKRKEGESFLFCCWLSFLSWRLKCSNMKMKYGTMKKNLIIFSLFPAFSIYPIILPFEPRIFSLYHAERGMKIVVERQRSFSDAASAAFLSFFSFCSQASISTVHFRSQER